MTEEQVLKSVFECFRRHFPTGEFKLLLVGSRAARAHKLTSDFDFVVFGSTQAKWASLQKFKESLDDLGTLYSFDVVDFQAAGNDFKAIALKGAMEVTEDGKLRPVASH